MTKKIRFVIHIGTEKTGSSSIQKMLHKNSDLLQKYGIFYYPSPNRIDSREISAAALGPVGFDDFLQHIGIETLDERVSFIEEIERSFAYEMAHLPGNIHTVVLSSEHFHSRLTRGEQLDWMKNLVDPFAENVEIIVYLRRQVDLAVSAYSTELKNGISLTLEGMLDKRCSPDNHFYNYSALLALWSECFGLKSIHPKIYERNHLLKGEVTLDFLHELTDNAEVLNSCQLPNRLNQSLHPLARDMLLAINQQKKLDQSMRTSGVAALVERIVEAFSGSFTAFAATDYQSVQDRFAACNECVRQAWFPELPTLFDPDAADALLKHETVSYSQHQLDLIRQVFIILEKTPNGGINAFDRWASHFRDLAIQQEQVSLDTAISLMELAYFIRPYGPVINRKLGEYSILRKMPRERLKRLLK